MNTPKNHKNKGPQLLPKAIFLFLIVYGVIAFISWTPSAALSKGSIQTLHALNSEYGMVIDSLSPTTDSFQANLFQANSLDMFEVEEKGHRGLVITLDDELSDGVLQLHPAEPMTQKELEEAAEEYEEQIPEFLNVEIDQDVILMGEPQYHLLPEYLDRLLFSLTPQAASVNEKIQVGIIDSGLDLNHKAFTDIEIMTGWNTISDNTKMFDDVGHGTHIAGILTSHNPYVAVIPYKIVDKNGGRLSNVLEAFDRAIKDQPDVINASFGLAQPSYALQHMMRQAYVDDIIVVAAAGNNNRDKGFYPATYSTTLAVGSINDEDLAMEKSNFGEWVDVAAFGYKVKSTLPGDSFGYKSGTSQSAALVSARVARLIADKEEYSLESVIEELTLESEEIESGKLAGTPIVK